MRQAKYSLLALMLFGLAIVGATLLSQGLKADTFNIVSTTQATVAVTVTDEVGLSINDVAITLTAQDGTIATLTKPTTDGSYNATVSPGTYTIRASAPGYQTDDSNVTLAANERKDIAFYLKAKE